MPYPSGTTMARIIAKIRLRFENDPAFGANVNITDLLLDFANESLDEIYQYASPERGKQTFTTTVDDWDYLVGTDPVASPITDEMGEILRLDYDGVPLTQLFTEDQVTLPTSSSASGTPSTWFQIWNGNSRYICFSTPPDSAVTVTLWYLKKADVLTATTSTPKLFDEFWFLFTQFMFMKVFEWLGKYDEASYYRKNYIRPGLRALNRKKHALFGRKAYRRQHYGAQDLLD